MPDSVLGKIAVEIGGGTAANGGGGGSPSSSSISGGGDADTKKNLGLLSNMRQSLGSLTKSADGQPRFWTKALKTMGIQVGLAGILKQSQIFTSTLGSLFQILGAFVDVILAPWMPMFIPMIRNLARQIPRVKKWSEGLYKWVTQDAGPWLMKAGKTVKDIITKAWDWIGGFFDVVFDSEKWGPTLTAGVDAVKKWFGNIKWGDALSGIWNKALDMLKGFWDSTLGGLKIFGTTIPSFGTKEGEKDDKQGQRGSEDEQRGATTLGGGPGRGGNGNGKPGWKPTLENPLAPLDRTVELFQDAIEDFANMDFATQVGAGYGGAMALRYGATPLKIVTKAMAPGLVAPLIDVVTDAMKKPHQILNFLAKNTGKAMAATFGKITGMGSGGAAGAASDDMVEMLEDMYNSSRNTAKPKPKPKGVLDFSRFRGVGEEAGEVAGERGVGRVKPVVSAAQKITVETYRKAISKAEEFRGWLAQIKPGESNLVQKANARMKVLWGAFGNIAHLPGGAAMRPAFSLLTRFAKFLIPGLATTFVVRETQYEIDKMMASDMPWLKDPGDIKAWAADAGVLGAGAAAGATSPMHGGLAQMLGIGPYGKDKEMGQASQMYMEAQAAHFQTGALSQGKLAPILMRLLGGGLEAGGSLLGAPGLAVSGAGFTMNELARQRMGMGLGTGQGYAEQQLINDLKMLIPGWGTQKVTIDGQAGESYYTTGAEN